MKKVKRNIDAVCESYYEGQLNTLQESSSVSFKMQGDKTDSTKWMNLNEESAKDLINFLTVNFIK